MAPLVVVNLAATLIDGYVSLVGQVTSRAARGEGLKCNGHLGTRQSPWSRSVSTPGHRPRSFIFINSVYMYELGFFVLTRSSCIPAGGTLT